MGAYKEIYRTLEVQPKNTGPTNLFRVRLRTCTCVRCLGCTSKVLYISLYATRLGKNTRPINLFRVRLRTCTCVRWLGCTSKVLYISLNATRLGKNIRLTNLFRVRL